MKMKKRSVPITEHFDSVSSQIAGAMRSVFVKYKSLTENLGEVQRGMESAKAIKKDGTVEDITLYVKGLTEDEKTIILEGCLMNYYAAQNK